MSYCRWSSDNFKSDVYAYESDSGYIIHIASNRIVGEPPTANWDYVNEGKEGIKKYIAESKVRSDWMESCERVPIGLPYDGKTFTCMCLQDFYNKMIELKNIGYNVPDFAIQAIVEEMDS